MIRCFQLTCVAFVALAHSAAAQVTSFDDIHFWVGVGTNRAVMVVDWVETPDQTPLAWGYRWSGTATGEDMFRAIVRRDPRLYGRMGEPGSFGVPLFGIGYDRDGDGFALSDGTIFVDGMAITGPSDGAIALDPDDSYNEGWDTGFWAYYVSDGNPYQAGTWESPMTGFSERILADGDWDGFSFAPGFVGDPPAIAAAAQRYRVSTNVVPNTALPEPTMVGWSLVLLVGWHCRRRRESVGD